MSLIHDAISLAQVHYDITGHADAPISARYAIAKLEQANAMPDGKLPMDKRLGVFGLAKCLRKGEAIK